MPVNDCIHAKLCRIGYTLIYFLLHLRRIRHISALFHIHGKTDCIHIPVITQSLVCRFVVILCIPLQAMGADTMNLKCLSILIHKLRSAHR